MIKEPKKRTASRQEGSGPRMPERSGLRTLGVFALGVVVAAVVQFLVLMVAAPTLFGGGKSTVAPAVTTSKADPAAPWGRIDYTEVMLDRPDESFPASAPTPPEIKWFFKNYSREQAAVLIESSDLTKAQKGILLEPARCDVRSEGLYLTPPIELVRDMSKGARRKIYSVLGGSETNLYQRRPYRFTAGELERSLELSKLAPATIKLIKQLTYETDGSTCFADSQLLPHLLPPEELAPSARVLSQTPTLLMKLRVTPDTDIDALLKYWGRARRGVALKPLLKSMGKVPGGASISIVNLLPPFARQRLHTYPSPALDKTPVPPDCFWSAMNFFNSEPDNRFFDPDHIRKVLATEYSRVEGAREFGDLILLHDQTGQALHQCVFIADDVVFTKNGAGVLSPWVLQKLSDMMAQYPSDQPLHQVVYRRKSAWF